MDMFTTTDTHLTFLRTQIASTESQLRTLKAQLAQAELSAQTARQLHEAYQGGFPAEWIEETLGALDDSSERDIARKLRQDGGFEGAPTPAPAAVAVPVLDAGGAKARAGRWPLADEEYKRYGRQMIMPEIGLHGQLRLKNAKVLVVGLGGLGCPAAAYLAGAGVGTLGLMDGDTVEVSNLHRQIAHKVRTVGGMKVDSAVEFLQAYVKLQTFASSSPSDLVCSLNPNVKYAPYRSHLSPDKAVAIFERYDLVLDCTDHPTSRYLISDACVLAGKPLVSASALKTEGQLLVLNNPPRAPGDASSGPCYRCIFPKPPPADAIQSCGEGGILGPVVGVMGVLQALEAIRLLTAKPPAPPPMTDWMDLSMDSTPPVTPEVKPTMLMFSAYNTPQFRSVRLRSRRTDCAACSYQATVTQHSLTTGSTDYIAFCGSTTPLDPLPPESRISARDFARLPTDGSNILIDVRDETQYSICALRGSTNIPWNGNAEAWVQDAVKRGVMSGYEDGRERFVVCRLGNDSQLVVRAVREWLGSAVRVREIEGGFRAWREGVDRSWPKY
ncbi:hypothetical protein LTR62_006615 [Meristemomyces frigidus]|uniref:Adenylyltransferase and sulfurtransferase uba4 n=1 Tax=Meristemomyces frigidus TaxID=1508187 RepID=A0AAN7YJ97_9PEZI|nr:hypothetical protein LTR62_006615 [Meristemomyces frigidus]